MPSLWDTESASLSDKLKIHSASFVLCDSSRILTGECTDKRVSLCEEIANCRCCFSFMRMTNCGATKRSRIIVNA